MTIIYSPIADYRERLFRVIAAMEHPEFDVYSDGPTTGHPTIGIGYDLTVPRSLESVLTAIGFDLGNAVDVAAMTQISDRIRSSSLLKITPSSLRCAPLSARS